jgi:prepilin-type N-terminal cleavage/methylation domain-containing protein
MSSNIARSIKVMNHYRRAFTIVELLIVIVVIAILAAISIVAYNGIQNRARASAASSALSQAAKKIALYQVDNSTYPTTGNLAAAGVSNTSSTYYQYSSTGSTYCLTASVSGTSYNISNTNQVPQAGACSGQVDGGVITNMVVNPSFESNTDGVYSYLVSNSNPTGSAYSGNRFLRSTRTATSGSWGPWLNATENNVITSGQSYFISVMVRSNVNTPHTLRVEWLNSANNGIIRTDTVATASPTTSWTNISGTAVAPADAARIRLTFYAVSDGTTTEYIDVDGIIITTTGQASFADGNSSNWSWAGTSNNSTSSGPPL